VVDKLGADEIGQPVRPRPVGVQFDQHVPVFDDPEQHIQVLPDERLAAADADRFQPVPAAFQERDKIVQRNGVEGLGPQDEVGVMAEGAAKIASAQENRRRDEPREIERGELL